MVLHVAAARYGDPDAILMSAYVAESNYSMYREYKYGYETTLTTFLSAFGTKDGERIEGAADLNVTTTICFPNASEVITFFSRVKAIFRHFLINLSNVGDHTL